MLLSHYPSSSYLDNNSPLIYGCMGLGGNWDDSPINKELIKQAHDVVDAALEAGIRVFDHADIYTLGKAELVFGEVLKQRPELLDNISIQSKCGIRFAEGNIPGRYDFSPEWIEHSVNGILQRLQLESIDVLLLHRPDPLMEPALVAEIFDKLHQQGKVKNFGVSNMNAQQMQFLQSELKEPLVCNQLELSLSKHDWLDETISTNCNGFQPTNFASGSVEYCRQNSVQLQAWGSLSQGLFTGQDVSDKAANIQNTARLVGQLASEYQTSPEAIVLSWLMQHPSKIQPVIGTTNLDRIKACSEASKIRLTREQWYQLFVSVRGNALP